MEKLEFVVFWVLIVVFVNGLKVVVGLCVLFCVGIVSVCWMVWNMNWCMVCELWKWILVLVGCILMLISVGLILMNR